MDRWILHACPPTPLVATVQSVLLLSWKGKGYPLQYSGLENSMDCIVHGAAKSRTRLSDFPFTSLHFIVPLCNWFKCPHECPQPTKCPSQKWVKGPGLLPPTLLTSHSGLWLYQRTSTVLLAYGQGRRIRVKTGYEMGKLPRERWSHTAPPSIPNRFLEREWGKAIQRGVVSALTTSKPLLSMRWSFQYWVESWIRNHSYHTTEPSPTPSLTPITTE